MRRAGVVVVVVLLALVVAYVVAGELDWPAHTTRAETVIDAPRREVWRVITDFAAYAAWNPVITRIDGRPQVGSDVTIETRTAGGGNDRVVANIFTVIEGRKIRWQDRLLLPGLRDREFEVYLENAGPDGVRVIETERVEGFLEPFTDAGPIGDRLQAMLDALKRRAEGSA